VRSLECAVGGVLHRQRRAAAKERQGSTRSRGLLQRQGLAILSAVLIALLTHAACLPRLPLPASLPALQASSTWRLWTRAPASPRRSQSQTTRVSECCLPGGAGCCVPAAGQLWWWALAQLAAGHVWACAVCSQPGSPQAASPPCPAPPATTLTSPASPPPHTHTCRPPVPGGH
jgi:hypothetical protein